MFEKEVFYKTSRSGGSGGQNVNKVSSKAELNFDVARSRLLTEEEKHIIFQRLSGRINKEGILKVTAETSRSQLENKHIAFEKFIKLISDCLKEKKKRVATKASKGSKEKRIHIKKIRAERKAMRRKPGWE
jgi:ribosome-associated protein